jgi:hypothetical protein
MPSRDCKGAVTVPQFPLPDGRGSDAVYFQGRRKEPSSFIRGQVSETVSRFLGSQGDACEGATNRSRLALQDPRPEL